MNVQVTHDLLFAKWQIEPIFTNTGPYDIEHT